MVIINGPANHEYMKKLLLLFAFLYTQSASAQSVLRFQHINVEDGLSQSSVNHIFQDAHGFMWFATGDGLNRYDGKQFVVYKSSFNDTLAGSMKDRNINSKIFEDKNNRLWFSSDAGVTCMDTRHHKFKVVLDKYTAACSGVLNGIDSNSLLLSIPKKGFYNINLGTLQTNYFPFTDKWQTSKEVNSIISGIYTGKGLWTVDKAGLLYFDLQTKKDCRKMVKNDLKSVCLLKNGNLLLGATNGVYYYHTVSDSVEFIEINERSSKTSPVWNAIAEDTISSVIYIAALYGGTICKLNMATRACEFLNFEKGQINDLFIDRSENLWVGTDGDGVYKLDVKKPKFYCFGPKAFYDETEQNSFFVKSIYCGNSGEVWMGVFNNGLITYDPATRKQEKIPIPSSYENQLISAIIKDSLGNIVTTVGNAIFWLDERSHSVLNKIVLPATEYFPSVSPTIYAFIEWKKGHYLAGTNLGTYSVKLENGIAHAVMPWSFSHDSLLAWPYNFYKTGNGDIYVGLRSGFIHLQIISDSTFHILDFGFRNIPVRHFYKSKNTPILWIASEQGLIAYNEHTRHYKVFDERSGLANSFIYAILDQNDSTLWISSNNGLSNVQVRYEEDGQVNARFINYSMKEGLQSNEFNTGAYFKGKDGSLFFGGIAGINWFYPLDTTNANLFKAHPAISAIYINDSLYAGDTAIFVEKIILPYSRNTISLSFSALEFTKPGQSQFAYKLDGIDNDWVHSTDDNVRYSNLPPGSYEFQLKVSNSDGTWNDDPLRLQIVIRPPYWKTWWFRSLIVMLIIAVIYLLAKYYVRQKVKAKSIELEKQQALYMERLRISKDVHDDLGSGLSKISLMAAIAQKKTGGNAMLGNDIKHISAVSKELVDNMRDLIWVLNPENTTLEQLVSRLREYCSDYLENIPIKVIIDFPVNVPGMRISREAQRNIFLTVKEAINNCVKHADASEIKIRLGLDTDNINILVADNGRGFDMAHLKGSGNGLRNMKQRIESIGGSFLIESSPDTSTAITITITFEKLCLEKIPL
jgi:signal transduction histidine kinase/ligand-binding sensor domain-containing protein